MFLLSLLVPHVMADIKLSSSWRKPDIVDSVEKRMNIASAALEVATSRLNSDAQFDGSDYGATGYLFAEMAEFDIASNQTKYKDPLKFYFSTVKKARPSFEDELLEETLSAAISTNIWQGQDGVIRTGNFEIVRALAAAYSHNSTSSDMRSYIQQYLGVQYNALIELATEDNSNIYGKSWLGPPSDSFSAFGQVNALSALIAAIPLDTHSNEPGFSSSTAPIATGKSSPNSRPSANFGKTIGGAVGGVFFILVVGIILFLLRQKKHHQKHQLRRPKPFVLNDSSREQPLRTKDSHACPSGRQMHDVVNYLNSPQLPRRHGDKRSICEAGDLGPLDSPLSDENWEVSHSSLRNVENFRNNVTTAELVTILAERLQYGQWQEEMPPEYPESSRGRGRT
ncbi:hypothetical protein VKT23_016974 [Stygiomarasmius scandens]|uniref:Uncharacterized protein n=1 Tax=Marasmiellus scandens TaxID=2682957 RepID=A0ABR1IV07_9AGAR